MLTCFSIAGQVAAIRKKERMIKFFRKIRFNLLEENKIVKYLKYAFGEIVLVVVGILIFSRNKTLDMLLRQAEIFTLGQFTFFNRLGDK
jgi:hydrogenase maturation factor